MGRDGLKRPGRISGRQRAPEPLSSRICGRRTRSARSSRRCETRNPSAADGPLWSGWTDSRTGRPTRARCQGRSSAISAVNGNVCAKPCPGCRSAWSTAPTRSGRSWTGSPCTRRPGARSGASAAGSTRTTRSLCSSPLRNPLSMTAGSCWPRCPTGTRRCPPAGASFAAANSSFMHSPTTRPTRRTPPPVYSWKTSCSIAFATASAPLTSCLATCAYKRIWATDYVRVESYIGALNWRGALLLRVCDTRLVSGMPDALRDVYRTLPVRWRNAVHRRLRGYRLVNHALHLTPAPTAPPDAVPENGSSEPSHRNAPTEHLSGQECARQGAAGEPDPELSPSALPNTPT